MLTGGIICAFSMLLLGILSTQAQLKGTSTLQALVIFIFSIFLFGFNFGLAPCSYLVAGEIPAQNLRGYTAGLSTAMGFLFAWLTAYTAPYFVNPAELNWGGRYGLSLLPIVFLTYPLTNCNLGFVWFGAMTSVILFIFFFLPEMQGRTLEEIEEMFDKGIAAKDFPTYVCTNAVLAREEAERDLFGNEKAAALHAGDAQHIEDV
jgi:SP family sugar:H+ symporter-like MFS transporter